MWRDIKRDVKRERERKTEGGGEKDMMLLSPATKMLFLLLLKKYSALMVLANVVDIVFTFSFLCLKPWRISAI